MMKATHQWIDSYVGSGLDAAEVARRLTLAGTEVEKAEPVGADTCFTLEVTSNRVDCLGVLGLARELAATLGREIKLPDVSYAVSTAPASGVASVSIEPGALAACPYYTAQVIRGVKVGPSPDWLKQRLEAIGLKPINNIVDITNFVLYETGQPLHAFDLNKLAGRRIVVRYARDKEQFRPIADRKGRATIALDSRTLIIADAERAQAVAGVMGGADSEVNAATTDILLESAYFEPAGNRQTGRRLELDSDSHYRFSRGVDIGGVLYASRRAARLMVEIAGGQVLDGVLEAGSAEVPPVHLTVTEHEVRRVLGVTVPRAEIETMFRGLGLGIEGVTLDAVTVQVPGFRRDLRTPRDLVEEVGRIWGLDRVPAPLRMTVAIAKPTRRQRARVEIRRALMGQGFSEALTDTFVGDAGPLASFGLDGDSALRLAARNPVNAALPALRRNLMASLLGALCVNERQGNRQVRLFEVANVFAPSPDGTTTGERARVALLAPDFLQARGAVEALLESLRVKASLAARPLAHAAFLPGRAARLGVGGRELGVVAEPSAESLRAAGADGPCALAELDLDALVEAWVETPTFEEMPRFPTAERDLAFVLDAATSWADVEAAVRRACDRTLREVELFDEFRGKGIAPGRKSLAFRMRFRHDDRTLTAEEISAQMNAAIRAVTEQLGGNLRG
ncbi:MAG: phenylalanine--tRNA ligase subunit beta [Planctomycetes bacterium]|nr:phenylalanine--tRNA ligase subunit beta [Planctomycetota bacterium]MCL4729547.1 phenylalanine--tRNA ligase subunit beta [Planctomycetota bacterium]